MTTSRAEESADKEGVDPVDNDHELFGNYDWMYRAWQGPQSPARRLGIDLPAAVAQLRVLYPSDVCQRMVARGDGYIIVDLFLDGWILPRLSPLLFLGHDLGSCPRWERDAHLVAELQRGTGWPGARFEVAIWAELCRLGADFAREPRSNDDDPAPDFLVRESGRAIALEAKAIRRSLYDKKYDALEAMVDNALGEAGVHVGDPQTLTLWVDDSLVYDVTDPKCSAERFDERLSLHLEPLRRWASRHRQAKTFQTAEEIPGIARITRSAAPAPNTLDIGFGNLEPAGVSHSLDQALRLVQSKAAGQLAAAKADLAVAAVWVSSDAVRMGPPMLLEKLAADAKRHAERYRPVDWIVLVGGRFEVEGWRKRIVAARMPWARGPIEGSVVLNALKRWKYA